MLSVLLAASLVALCSIIIYKNLKKQTVSVSVPDNYISDNDKGGSDTETAPAAEETEAITEEISVTAAQENTYVTSSQKTGSAQTETETETEAAETEEASTKEVQAVGIVLSSRNSDDNVPFNVENMFPGDSITKYFRVEVYYKNTVYVRYHADIRPGYEKLAEVLKCRIKVNGEVIYDGLMEDMPEAVTYTLTSDEKTTTALLYEITAYLDTDVGNDYMEKELIADFRWWVEEKGNLTPPPTGDTSHVIIWAAVAVVSFSLLLVIIFKRRRRKEEVDE